jgi:CHAT domain-containing protein/tetratricopeptide (TPR) repeat protein
MSIDLPPASKPTPAGGTKLSVLPRGLAAWSLPDNAFDALLLLSSAGHDDSHWRDIYRMAVDVRDARTAQIALTNIGNCLARNGRYAEAEACSRRRMAWAIASGDTLGMGHACISVAAARWSTSNVVGAVTAAHHALRLADLAADSACYSPGFSSPATLRLAVREQLLTIRLARGELRRARAEQIELLELHRSMGDVPAVAGALEGMGHLAKAMGRYADAFEWYEKGMCEIVALDPSTRDWIQAGLLGNAAVALTWLGDTEGALKYAREGRTLCTKLGDPIGIIASLGQEARAHLRAQAPRAAIPLLEDMLKRSDMARVAGWRKAAHANLATAFLAQGQRAEAVAHCETAFALAEDALGNPSLEDWWLRVEVAKPTDDSMVTGEPVGDASLCLALAGFAVEALQGEQKLSRPSALAERWIDEMEAIIVLAFGHEATALKVPGPFEVAEPLQGLAAVAAGSPFQGWAGQDIGFYCAECLRAQEFQEQLRLGDAELEHPSAPSPLDFQEEAPQNLAPYRLPVRLAELQAALFKDELFLGFILTGQAGPEQRLHGRGWTPWPAKPSAPAFVVAAMKDWSAVVPLGATGALEAAVGAFSVSVADLGEDMSPDALEVLGADLYHVLLAPALQAAGSHAEKVHRITVAPDGAVNGLPFDLLVVEQRNPSEWREMAWLGRHRAVSITPSGTVLTDIRAGANATGPRGNAFVGLGDPTYVRPRDEEQLTAAGIDAPLSLPRSNCNAQPLLSLPGSRLEVESISHVFRSAGTPEKDVVILLSDAAAKANLTPELLERATYLHLACHGTAGQGTYLDGALFLADATHGDDEGVLTAQEIATLRTGARLVVMSACETARGVLARGEGLQGMVRAWLVAGAESVIASLWEVDDESTARLMEELYRQLLAGASIREALGAAKRLLMDDPQWGHPSYWAAFVQFADAEERRAPPRIAATLIEQSLASGLTKDVENVRKQDLDALSACASAWTSWRAGKAKALFDFLVNAQRLGGLDIHHPDAAVLLACVVHACDTARQVEVVAGRTASAVAAYKTQLALRASTQRAEWDALASAYSDENMARVRTLMATGLLRRDFVVRLTSDFHATLDTITTWLSSASGSEQNEDDLLISSPCEDQNFVCTVAGAFACREAKQLVFPLGPSQQVTVTERLSEAFRLIPKSPDDVRLHVAAWGSVRYRTSLTLLLAKDFLPIRTQLEAVCGPIPSGRIVTSSDGLRITIGQDSEVPWLAHFGVMIRHVPGASAFLARKDQPFAAGMSLAEYEALFACLGRP